MRYLRSAFARVVGFFTLHRSDEELQDELHAHLDMATAANIRRGMNRDDARRMALIEAGGLTAAAESVRAQRGLPWLEGLVADVRYAARTLRHSRAYTIVVVLTLALGIGANTAIFSVVRGVLLKPLPHRDGDRLVYLRQSADGPGGENLLFSVPEIRDFRAGAPAFSGIAEYSPWNMTLLGHDDAMTINAGLVTGNYFDVMGLKPILGRVTRPSDDGPGVPAVMVLTYDFWMTRFGGDPNIVGKQLRFDGTTATVIGVLEPAPTFPDRMDVLSNMVVSKHHLSAQMIQVRSHRMTEVVARLGPGATLEQGRAQIASTYANMQRDYKSAYDPGSHYRVAVIPFKQAIGQKASLTLWLLMAAAAFVLIISAANVVNLTLMRGVRREPELVVRAAMGAGVPRLRRLLLAENLLLTLTGALLGIVLAVGTLRMLISFAARYTTRSDDIRLDLPTLGFTLALSLAVALILSFVAALPEEGRFASWISAGARRVSGGVRRQRLQRGLVVAQIAVSVVLLAGAGLLTRTMIQLSQVNTGLRTDEVLTLPVSLARLGNGDFTNFAATDAAAKEGYARIESEIRARPGVVAVGVGSTLPLHSGNVEFDLKAEGHERAVGEATPHADVRSADPDFFRAAGIPLLEGRVFAATDAPGRARVVVLNETLAKLLFREADPIGRRVALTGDILPLTPWSGDWRTVVGVVGDTRDAGLDAAAPPEMYMPFAQEIQFSGGLVIRADSNVAALASAATQIVRRIAPNIPIEHVQTITQLKAEGVAPRRLNAELISSFGALAVLIAAVGIAGMLAFSVSSRTNEIGIRMSLGADSGRVQRMILWEGGVLLILGLAIGVGAAYFAGGVIRGLLFGVAPHDPVTFIWVAGLMAAIGVVACWIPALRAARIDPAIAMRA